MVSATSSPADSAAWHRSIDSVYSLFETEDLAARYPALSKKVRRAVELTEEVLREFSDEDGWALSFNGGKDCTVLVHILLAVLRRLSGASHAPSTSNGSSSTSLSSSPVPRIPTLYITSPSPFSAMEHFILESIHRYGLDLVKVKGDMKAGLEEYLEGGGETWTEEHELGTQETEDGKKVSVAARQGHEGDDPRRGKRNVKAMFIGTRRNDPHGSKLQDRQKTDPGWPQVERVHPVLDWTYAEVWEFLRCPALAFEVDISSTAAAGTAAGSKAQGYESSGGLREDGKGFVGVPYCVLYDEGYTSLGSTYNTFPNPMLKVRESKTASAEEARFRPAYFLQDESQERAGRGERKNDASASS